MTDPSTAYDAAGPQRPARTRFAEPAARSARPGDLAGDPARDLADDPSSHREAPADVAVDAGAATPVPARALAGGSTRSALLPVLAALVLVLSLLVGFLAQQAISTRGTDPDELQRRDALAAARSSARVIFSYDYRHLSRDFAAGRAFTTGAFRTEYDTTTAKLVTDVAQRYRGVAVADVSAAAVQTSGHDRVVALVFLNQQSTSSVQTTPKISQSRLEMTLLRTRGRWLVSKVRAL